MKGLTFEMCQAGKLTPEVETAFLQGLFARMWRTETVLEIMLVQWGYNWYNQQDIFQLYHNLVSYNHVDVMGISLEDAGLANKNGAVMEV